MKLYVAVTDYDWFSLLKTRSPVEINFWQPNSNRRFRALQEGELFLFKLHSPHNYIVGGGIFARQLIVPLSLTWDAFEQNNGVRNIAEFRDRIKRYRSNEKNDHSDPLISSLILVSPFFLEEDQWIPVPSNWSPNIVSGKVYSTDDFEGYRIFQSVERHFQSIHEQGESMDRYGNPTLIKPRLGQASFRLLVTEAYHRRCSITGEKTLPVLDAAHIKPYSQAGLHVISNGLLLRKDLHTLFDRGYITVNQDYRIEVSRYIKEEYGNGKEYYSYHGKPLAIVPDNSFDKPSREFLDWHNNHVYIG